MERQNVNRFQVKQEKIKVLTVTVVKANRVVVRGFFTKFETPDPYVMLRVHTSPNSRQRTKVQSDTYNPVWNESFTFYLHHDKKNTLEITMKDEDYGPDDMIGAHELELDDLPMDTEITKILHVNKNTTLELKLMIKFDETKELRLSYDLCDEEKAFVQKRKAEILKHMPRILDENTAPRSIEEVPTIGIMGSGGGYRAVCGLSGVFCALQEAGILDCSSYVTGLSGSSWYISTLYQHEGWPDSISCQVMAHELKTKFQTGLLSHFHAHFFTQMREKAKRGQLVRLVDLFGLFIGDCLLDNQESRLSHQSQKVKYGDVALPITTGIRVRLDLPAAEFSEWVEFTPYEYGMAKYGVFGKTSEFGGKFYKGSLVKKFKESRLSYLQGIWGSAFGIILNTLHDRKNKSESEAEEELKEIAIEEAKRCKTADDDSDDEDETDGLPEDEIKDGHWLADALNPYNLIASRRGKAAEVFNILRGLQFKKEEDCDYDEVHGNCKTMCLVDSGIAFNSPYPTLLRPERKVEIILSFDFSQRDGGDTELSFKNIIKAENWAREHGLPFPQIVGNPVLENPEIQECYVFEDLANPDCPIVLHFPLVNKSFRDFSAPGVPRVDEESKDFGNFAIFDDPDKPYSSFNFQYTERSFDRLHELMKYNTSANLDIIKEKIAYRTNFRRNNPYNFCE
ncbi:cytosolic phospholipase A2-like [Dendronephthya gigantea]|uniref:cytosolic phospholipase A2-like n=1 Tax=Dendronephthya gigantea TaxID=151771 RepID=UPI00106AB957|nr:cytosolic phospholipase A2-like [Dendronephthya gigantea]XP_028398220.1 cytosolic phospholipase A2-like [Dendronephthya gigantea]XP_028398221.1 cytosolic phospholipase A2-like [Dendronephthya gigantea]